MRIKSSIRKVQRKVYLTESLSNKIDILLLDPVRGGVKYGNLSALLEALLTQWIEDQMGVKHEKEAPHVDG